MFPIHHFGQVVNEIEAFAAQSFWERRTETVVDPVQRARLALFGAPGCDGAPYVELVEPLDRQSPVWSARAKGGGWHHVCLRVATRARGDAFLRERRLLAVTEWTPAVLFGGCAVRFLYSRNRELIELLADEEE